MGIARELENIRRGLILPEEQGKVMGFLTNTKNVQRINDLVEDIREALMDYQVRTSNTFSTMADVRVRLRCNKISTTRVVG
jgi:hypothetical protein